MLGCKHKSDLNHKIIAIQILSMFLIVNFILIRGGDLIICLLVQSPVFGSYVHLKNYCQTREWKKTNRALNNNQTIISSS